MFSKIQLGLVLVSTAVIFANFYAISAEESADTMFHCSEGKVVMGERFTELQKNCSMELHSDPKNATCITICMMQHLEGLDANERPDKEKFDKVVDETFAEDLREKMKKTDCFEHAPKIEKGEKLCETLHDFEVCMCSLMQGICAA